MKKNLIMGSFYQILQIVIGLLIFWSSLRLLLYINHFSSFAEVSPRLLVLSFAQGVRFDLSTIFYTNLLFFILLYFKRISSSFLYKVCFVFFNSLFGVMHLGDMEYFGLMGRRVDRSFLSVAGETKMTSYMSFLYEYGYMIFFFLLFVVYMSFLAKFLNSSSFKKYKVNFAFFSKYVLYFFLLASVSVISVRGGFQRKPLSIVHAYEAVDGNGKAANLSLNTVYNFIRSKGKNPFPARFRNAEGPFTTDHKFTKSALKLKKTPKNVLFIFIESMSTYSLEKQEKSFIHSFAENHQKASIYITEHFGNGRFSMDALTSVFLGVPSFFELFLFKSNFAQNKWVGFGDVLQDNGFSTFFIHAAEPGTMYFDKIAPAVGILDFHSLSNKKGKGIPSEMMAPWGVHDEYMYKKSLPIIRKQKEPFMGVLFSVSSHIPYETTPGDSRPRSSKAEENYLRAINYADRSLENYFATIKNEPWFSNTLFIITGDHSPPLKSKWLQTPKEQSRVPLLFYLPDSNLGELSFRKVTQHLDLSMSIFDLLDIEPKEWSPYGTSMFDLNTRSLIGYYWDQSFNFVEGDCLSKISVIQPDRFEVLARNKKAHCTSNLGSEQITEYEDFIKSYVYRLENNKIYY